MTSVLEILEPGLLTTVQDAGRTGHQRYGVPVSGALDPIAYGLANRLAGASEGAAALEMRFIGPTVRAHGGPVRLAVVGAVVTMRLSPATGAEGRGAGDVQSIAADRTVTLAAGDTLTVGPLREGATAYLAVAGGFTVASVMGSAATYVRGGFGGIDGRSLRAGDRLAIGPGDEAEAKSDATAGPERVLPPAQNLDVRAPADPIRVVPGPQDDHFTAAAMDTFLTTSWRVTNDADRMGLRLDGPALAHRDGYNIVSDGIATGAIQVPGNGRPIILLADRQTTGGYPKIATVISPDVARLAHTRPGDELRFRAVTPGEANAITRAAHAALVERMAGIAPLVSDPRDLGPEALLAGNLVSGVWSDDSSGT